MSQVLVIFIGGGAGAVSRHLVSLAALRAFGPGFPLGTMAVNVVGSLAMGLFIGWLARRSGMGAELKLLVATGFLGGFTTFSAFSLDAVNLWERGDIGGAALYILGSVVLSLAGLVLGLYVARSVF